MSEILRKGDLFTIASTGKSGMSQRGLGRACGVSHTAIQKLEKQVATKQAPKRLKRFEDRVLRLATKKGFPVVYTAAFCAAVIKHYAYLGSETAQDIDDAVGEIGLTSYIQGETNWLPKESQSSQEARSIVSNRIEDDANPWTKLFEKEMCIRVAQWFKSSDFYWDFFYYWMTAEERTKLNRENPVVNGRRKQKIHQWITPQIKERLRDKANGLHALLRASRTKQQFLTSFQNAYGAGWQISLDI